MVAMTLALLMSEGVIVLTVFMRISLTLDRLSVAASATLAFTTRRLIYSSVRKHKNIIKWKLTVEFDDELVVVVVVEEAAS